MNSNLEVDNILVGKLTENDNLIGLVVDGDDLVGQINSSGELVGQIKMNKLAYYEVANDYGNTVYIG